MRKGIMGTLIGIGLVFSQVGMAQDLKGKQSQENKFATQNYYKHDKDARQKAQKQENYTQAEKYDAYKAKEASENTSVVQARNTENQMNYFTRDHR